MADNRSPSGMLSADEHPVRGGLDVWALPFRGRTDGRLSGIEVGPDSAADKEASRSRRPSGLSATRLGRIRPFGYDAATSTSGCSTFFASNAAAAARWDSRSKAAREGLVSDDCTLGLEGVGSLGRRRTSTMNGGTARLNVVLDTAHGSADSPRPKRPCEAKRSKAIGRC